MLFEWECVQSHMPTFISPPAQGRQRFLMLQHPMDAESSVPTKNHPPEPPRADDAPKSRWLNPSASTVGYQKWQFRQRQGLVQPASRVGAKAEHCSRQEDTLHLNLHRYTKLVKVKGVKHFLILCLIELKQAHFGPRQSLCLRRP